MSDGHSIANRELIIEAIAANYWGGVETFSGKTDADGSFEAQLIMPTGDCYILVRAKGFMPQWWHGESLYSEPLQVTPVEDSASTSLNLFPGGTINGTVSDNAEILKDSITLTCIDQEGFGVASDVVSEGASTFEIAGLPEGAYYLMAESHAYSDSYYPDAIDPSTAEMLLTEKGRVTTVHFRVSAINTPEPLDTGVLVARVSSDGSPVEGVFSTYIGYEDARLNDRGTAADGSFIQEIVAGIPFKLEVTDFDDPFLCGTWYPSSCLWGSSGICVGTPNML